MLLRISVLYTADTTTSCESNGQGLESEAGARGTSQQPLAFLLACVWEENTRGTKTCRPEPGAASRRLGARSGPGAAGCSASAARCSRSG